MCQRRLGLQNGEGRASSFCLLVKKKTTDVAYTVLHTTTLRMPGNRNLRPLLSQPKTGNERPSNATHRVAHVHTLRMPDGRCVSDAWGYRRVKGMRSRLCFVFSFFI